MLLSDIGRLLEARAALDLSPMGAAAITTSGFPIDRARVAELLGFAAPKRNAYGCIASVDYVTGLYSALKLPFLHLGRLIQDFQFWSAFEVGQLHLPGGLVQISSIMPQKRNPVPIEHLRHLASATCGHCDTVTGVMHNTPFTDMNDSEGEVQQAGYAAFDSGGRVLRLLSAVIGAAKIDAARVRRTTEAACITVTELADTLVREEGLSFRQAHDVAAAARAVIAGRRTAGRGLRRLRRRLPRRGGARHDADARHLRHGHRTRDLRRRARPVRRPRPCRARRRLRRLPGPAGRADPRHAAGPARIAAADDAPRRRLRPTDGT